MWYHLSDIRDHAISSPYYLGPCVFFCYHRPCDAITAISETIRYHHSNIWDHAMLSQRFLGPCVAIIAISETMRCYHRDIWLCDAIAVISETICCDHSDIWDHAIPSVRCHHRYIWDYVMLSPLYLWPCVAITDMAAISETMRYHQCDIITAISGTMWCYHCAQRYLRPCRSHLCQHERWWCSCSLVCLFSNF